MSPRAALAARIAVGLALGGGLLAACYDVPSPDCGYVCGPGGACPDGYICASDGICHRDGAPGNLVCAPPDAATDAVATGSGGATAGSDSTRPTRPATSPRGSW